MSITCSRCGNLLAPNARACPVCGTRVNQPDQTVRMQQPQQYTPQPFPQKKGNNTMLLVIITFLLIIAIIFLAVFLFRNSDKKKSATPVKTEQTTTVQKDMPKDRLEQLEEVVSQRNLSTSEVDELSANDKRLLRNYIYARHGYVFKDSQLSNYFGQFSWYSGRYTSSDQVERMFNSYERANVQKLTDKTVIQQPSSSTLSGNYYEFIGHCNIRAYPTESSAIIATREDGEICYISSREGDWYYITLANGTQGWTHRQNLRAGR